jgi:hypothetical protein
VYKFPIRANLISEEQKMADTKASNESLNPSYRYSRKAILLPNLVSIPVMLGGIWAIGRRDNIVEQLIVIALCFLILGVAIRPALRLSDVISLNSLGITKESRFGSVFIPWQSVVRIEPCTAVFELDCFRVVSDTGESITFSDYLMGFEELRSKIHRQVLAVKGPPPSLAGD